jgi:hypothetical protein
MPFRRSELGHAEGSNPSATAIGLRGQRELFDVGDAAAEEIRASGQVPQETVVVDL